MKIHYQSKPYTVVKLSMPCILEQKKKNHTENTLDPYPLNELRSLKCKPRMSKTN